MYRIALLVLVARTAAGGLQVCDLENSVDISSGTRATNGDILYENDIYRRHEYFIDNETLAERGCVCLKKTCIRKCCPIGQGYTVEKTCVNLNGAAFDPSIWDNYTRHSDLNVSRFGLVPGKVKCRENFYRLRFTNVLKGSFRLQVDGRLFIESPGTVDPWMKKGPDEYCIDTFVEVDEEGRTSTKLDALVCFPKDADDTEDYTISFTCMLISCVFFIVTIAVYAFLPELQNLHGRVLMMYLSCMCVAFSFLATLQILITIQNNTLTLCIGLTFVIYFSLLASFFWLNVMSFDIWWTFSGKRGLSLEKLSMRARFCAYAAYAFGFPTGFTIILAALEFSGLPSHPAMPMLRQQGCFLYGYSKLLYLYGPILILCIANMVFFVLTAWKITQIKQQTQKTFKSKDSSSTDQHRNDRQRLFLYVKLFVIMGINWILEVISGLYPETNVVFRFIDAYNVMIGVFIFFIFVCKRKIFRLMKKRFQTFRISQSDSGDLRPVGHRDVRNWKDYQQQRGSLDTVRTICYDSDNSRTIKTSNI